ncbi:MAG: lytic transglycosylase domain-containing protein, partial [Muribaculaceae bacterium]|nr:lytic transglycosylase domain-containing protein [Muribaculaceae bacterium]
VNGPVESWPDWAAAQSINYSILREENPWIRAKTLTNKTGKTYTVRIPEKESLSRSKCGTKVFNRNWVDR